MASQDLSLHTQKPSIHTQHEAQLDELTPLVMTPPPIMMQGNAIETHGAIAANPQSNDAPTEGLRQALQPTPTRADIERMAEARAMENPDYAELVSQLAQCDGLIDKFLAVDSIGLFARDGVITQYDLDVLINDVNTPNTAAREAAKFLNDHKWLWAEITKGDSRVSLDDVKTFIANLKARRNELKSAARDEIRSELNLPASQPNAGAQASGGVGAHTSASSSIPRPAPSTLPGMEGAMENLANTGDWLSQQMMDLAQKAAADPSKALLYQQQITQLQNQYQAVTNMMNQLTQTISNLSKMWSDVAMNSIRNLK